MPNWLTNPLIPLEWLEKAQGMIDSPTAERSPLEASLRGFGAGALEGLRDMTSPLNLALSAAPVARGAGALAGLSKAAPAMDHAADALGLGRSLKASGYSHKAASRGAGLKSLGSKEVPYRMADDAIAGPRPVGRPSPVQELPQAFSREIPYRAEDSFSTAGTELMDAYRTVARRGRGR